MLESYADCGVLRFDLDDEGLLNSVVDEVSGLYLEVFAGLPASNWLAEAQARFNVLMAEYPEWNLQILAEEQE